MKKGFKKGHKTNVGKKRPPRSKEWCENLSKSIKAKCRFGERAANWKGGKTRLTQLIRSSFKYRQWRSDVFQRDMYCCMDCGKKSNGDIEVHHIKPLAKIIAERQIKNITDAISCEELWNINNGLTLCIKCHKKTGTYCNQKNVYSFS